jgi:hypothetical protein
MCFFYGVCGDCGQDVMDAKRRTPLACFAIRQRKTECVRVILQQGVKLEGIVSGMAAVNGNLPCLRLAHEVGDTLRPVAYLAACGGTRPSTIFLRFQEVITISMINNRKHEHEILTLSGKVEL